MKTICLAAVFLISNALGMYGQGVGRNISATDVTSIQSNPTSFTVVERGANHRVWQKTTLEITTSGATLLRTHAYTELATGMHYEDANGQWQESKEVIVPSKRGGAEAVQGQHKVYFPSDIYNGVITLSMLDGKQLKSQVVGLSYSDGRNSVLIATITNSVGQILPSGNQVIYTNAFAGGITASLRYTYTKSLFEQDVLLETQLPAPEKFGLSSDTAFLEVITEFFDPPQPDSKEQIISSAPGLEQVNQDLNFSAMKMGQGRAFFLGEDAAPSDGIPVAKEWAQVDGRQFLFEQIPVTGVQDAMKALPPVKQSSIKPARGTLPHTAEGRRTMPKPRLAQTSTNVMRTAELKLLRNALVLDYTTVATSQTNMIFRGDSTYYLSGDVSLYGTNTVFEGGCVLKSASNVTLSVSTPVTWLGSSYRPVVMVSKNDDSVGETISGSTSNPTNCFAATAFYFDAVAANTNLVLQNLRIGQAQTALAINGKSGHVLSHVQVVACANGLALTNAEASLRNALFDHVITNFIGSSATGRVEHLTSDTANLLNNVGVNLFLTNCLLVAIADGGASAQQNVSIESTASGVFQAVGAGYHYLVANSTNRNAGTTSINASLAADLLKQTTYPPIVFSNTTISVNTNFYPQVQRDSDIPDIGYHYSSLDYLVDNVAITNATVTMSNGVVIGSYNSTGILPRENSAFISVGTPLAPNRIVRYSAVQEASVLANATDGISMKPSTSTSAFLSGMFRFTYFDCPAGSGSHLMDSGTSSFGSLLIEDCEFRNGQNDFSGPDSGLATNTFKNNLFLSSTFYASGTNVQVYLALSNNLIVGAAVILQQPNLAFWQAHDNAFDSCTIATNSWLTNTHNAYLNGTGRLSPTNATDIVLTNFNYVAGSLGNYYQASTNLIDRGSITADMAGLYHYTTQTNQLKETNSVVNIGYHYVAVDTNGNPIDTDGDGVPDYLEDSNGNGAADLGETDWTDYYNGVLPVVTIVSGNNQSGMPNTILTLPLIVSVTGTNGASLTNAPLTFSVTQGGAQLATSTNGTPGNNLVVRTATNGQASILVLLPSTLDTTIYITATAWSGTQSNQVTFTATTALGLKLWLKADAGITNNNVNRWSDQTTNHNDLTQTTASYRPLLKTNVLNGYAIVRFYNTNFLNLPNFLTSLTQAEVYVVIKAFTNMPTASRGLWQLGQPIGGSYPANSGIGGYIGEAFGRTNLLLNIGTPAQRVDQFHLYNVASQVGQWNGRINGKILYATTNRAVAFTTAPTLGYNSSAFFDGDIAEILLFNRVLSDDERDNIGAYLNQKYAWVSNAPSAPVGLSVQAVATNEVSLWWTNTLDNATVLYKIERKTGAGSYSQIVAVRDATSYLDTNVIASTTYTYRVKAWNYAGESAYSAEVSVTTPGSGTSLPLNDLKLWLSADAGIVRNNTNGTVSIWRDQSGNGNDATSDNGSGPTLSFQPQWVSGALNSRPVVRFDGNGRRLFLPNFLTNFSQAEVYVVLKATTNLPSSNRALWQFGTSPSYHPQFTGYISEDFGRTNALNTGTPAQRVDQYHLYNVASKSGEWGSRMNGKLHYTLTGNTVAFPTDGQVGYDSNSGSSFDGDIAELLFFNRVLSDDERDSIGTYLNQKYAWISAPATPVGLSVQAVATNQVSLWWTNTLDNNTVIYKIERKIGAGSYSQIATVRDATSGLDTNVVAGTTYTYRVKAWNYAGESSYSAEVSVTTPGSGLGLPFGDLKLWLKSDTGIVRNNTNGTVCFWLDQSGNGNHASSVNVNGPNSTFQPLWTNSVINGRPSVRFDGNGRRLFLPNFLTNLSQAEVYVVLKATTNLPSSNRSLWQFGTNSSYYPQSTGYIAEDFGRTNALNQGIPAQLISQCHLYNVLTKSNAWSSRINGKTYYSLTGNSVAFPTDGQLGYDSNSGFSFDGDVAELLLFNRVLTDDERDAIGVYLNQKYGWNGSSPATPTGLAAQAIATNQASLWWTNTQDNNTVLYKIERKIGAGGYDQIAVVRDATTYIDTNLVAGTTYTYRLKAWNYAGESSYSAEASVTTPSTGASLPFGDIKLWLRADAGVIRNGTSGTVGIWQDQSGNGNDATTSASSRQPGWVNGALNGRPVLRFDGSLNYFNLPNFLTNFAQAEIYVVLKAVTNVPAAQCGLWQLGASGGLYPAALVNGAYIGEGFGRTNVLNAGTPAQRVDRYHLYNVASQANSWNSRINGKLLYTDTTSATAFSTSPVIGLNNTGGGPSYYFAGDIAELVLFNRALNDDERDSVGTYLDQKYGWVTNGAATPVGLSAQAVATNQISVSWTNTLDNNTILYKIERKTGSGSYSQIATLRDATSYVDTNVTASTTYTYRVKAWNYAGESSYSTEASVTTFDEGASVPLGDLKLWLKADAGIVQNGTNGTIGLWLDQSGNGNNATAALSGVQPIWTNGVFNGRPVVRFNTASYFNLPNCLSSLAEAEVFVVLKAATNLPVAYRGLWQLGQPTGGYYPAINTQGGYISEAFGRTNLLSNTGVPNQRIDSYHLYDVSAKVGEWTSRINGGIQYTTNNGAVAFSASPYLGQNSNGGNRFDGDIAEILLFIRSLTPAERGAVGVYLNQKYNFLALPTGPIHLGAQTLSASQVALSWRQDNATNTGLYCYTIERRLGTNGAFQTIAQIAGDTRFFDAGLSGQTTYTYRVRNTFIPGADPSNEIIATTVGLTGQFPLQNVVMWLRGEDLALTNGASIAAWPDFWTTSLQAIQTNALSRPTLITNGFNAKSTVQFGGGTYLELPSVLTNASAAEIFVVLQSVTNSPATNQGLWRFSTNAPTWYPATNGSLQDAFGAAQSQSILPPVTNLTAVSIYNVAAATNLWRARLNGPVKQLLSTNTVQFKGIPWLGRSTQGATEPFAGKISQLIVFNRTLTLDEQKAVRDGLAQTYAVTLELPHVPSNLSVTRTNSVDSLLSWSALTGSENGLESFFVAERRPDTNGLFLPLQAISRTNTCFLDNFALPEIGYDYRLRVVNDVGETVSGALSATLTDTDGDGLPDYLESLIGTNPNNADTDGDGLPDGWEVRHGLDPLRADGRNGAAGDFDNDGISNLQEYLQGSDPADGIAGDSPLIRLQVHRPN